MLFLFPMHQDDGGWTLYVEDYSKVKIDDDDDDDSVDDNAACRGLLFDRPDN